MITFDSDKPYIPRYTIEPHGPEGNYALYFGRDGKHHGFRLLNLNDGDSHMAEHLKLIEDSLNQINQWLSVEKVDKDLLDPALVVFGTKNSAETWFNSPSYSLDWKRPRELIDTVEGKEQIRQDLIRMEGNVYF